MPRDAEGRHQPADIDLLPEAGEWFHRFVTEHGAFTEAIENAPVRFHYRKLAGVAARLALVFYLCDVATQEANGPEVQERHVLSGIALARWYGREAWRFYGALRLRTSGSSASCWSKWTPTAASRSGRWATFAAGGATARLRRRPCVRRRERAAWRWCSTPRD
jgi:hypothetical protein